MEIVENLIKLVPPDIDPEWINNVWECELMTIENLPDELEEDFDPERYSSLLMNITHSIKQALKAQNNVPVDDENGDDYGLHAIWVALKENDLSYKKILPIFCYFISRGTNNFEEHQSRHLALTATSCYFSLLSIPGSLTNNMYHSIMYTQSLHTLKLAIKISIAPSKKKRRGNAKAKQLQLEDDDEEEDDVMYQLSEHERREFVAGLLQVLHDLLLMLQSMSLKEKNDAIEHTIQQFIELTYLEHTSSIHAFIPARNANASALALNAFIGLQFLCKPLHGPVSELVTLVMKNILTLLHVTPQNSLLDLAPRELNIIRDNAVKFVGFLAKSVGQSSWKGIIILVQHLVTKSTERAENRLRASQIAVLLMRELPLQLRTKLMRWVFFMAHTEKPGNRLMALELVSQMMLEEECEDTDESEAIEMAEEAPEESISLDAESEGEMSVTLEQQEKAAPSEAVEEGEERNEQQSENIQESDANKSIVTKGHHAFKHKHMLGLILYRCNDTAPTVRAKALNMLVDFTCTRNKYMIEMLQQVFVEPYQLGQPESSADKESQFLSHEKFVRVMDKPELEVLPGGHVIVQLVRQMAADERVMVRKGALQALVNIARLDKYWLSQDLLELLSQHCRDPAMMIRKQMLQCMTDLLLKHSHAQVPKLPEIWLQSVLTNIHDPEIKVQELVLELLFSVLIGNLKGYGQGYEDIHELPWVMLKLIPQNDMHDFLSKAIHDWVMNKQLPSTLVATIQSHVCTEHNEQAWLMLSVIAENKPLTSPTFAYDFLQKQLLDVDKAELPVLYRVMRVLMLSVNHLNTEQREALKSQLLIKLREFSLPIELVGVSVDLLTALEIELANSDEEALNEIGIWCKSIFKELEEAMDNCLQKSTNKPVEQLVIRQICTLGDVMRVGNLNVRGHLVRVLHSILLANLKFTGTNKLKLRPKSLCIKPSVVLQAVTVAALGKMALQHESIAHELLPSFGFLLDNCKNSALRGNILSALADLCGRYAVLVDPLVPRMASCLRDPDTNLRQHALVLMVQLLQEDYVKLRHGLFYFLLRMLCDPESSLQDIANFYLTENLPKKKPNAMFASFLGALFFFNEYMDHENFSSMRLSVETIKLLALTGKENKAMRMRMYSFMLEHMDDDQRFQTMHRLCMDILGGFVDDKLSLQGAGTSLLSDTLAVLSCDDIKLRSMHAKPTDDNDVPDSEEASTNIMVTARKAVVTAVVKRNVMENIVPVIRSLKIKLQGLKSPLAEDLMNYLRDLMRDFKSEIQDILAGDRQLAVEVAFDIRQLEEQETAKTRPKTPETSELPESQSIEMTPKDTPDKGTEDRSDKNTEAENGISNETERGSSKSLEPEKEDASNKTLEQTASKSCISRRVLEPTPGISDNEVANSTGKTSAQNLLKNLERIMKSGKKITGRSLQKKLLSDDDEVEKSQDSAGESSSYNLSDTSERTRKSSKKRAGGSSQKKLISDDESTYDPAAESSSNNLSETSEKTSTKSTKKRSRKRLISDNSDEANSDSNHRTSIQDTSQLSKEPLLKSPKKKSHLKPTPGDDDSANAIDSEDKTAETTQTAKRKSSNGVKKRSLNKKSGIRNSDSEVSESSSHNLSESSETSTKPGKKKTVKNPLNTSDDEENIASDFSNPSESESDTSVVINTNSSKKRSFRSQNNDSGGEGSSQNTSKFSDISRNSLKISNKKVVAKKPSYISEESMEVISEEDN